MEYAINPKHRLFHLIFFLIAHCQTESIVRFCSRARKKKLILPEMIWYMSFSLPGYSGDSTREKHRTWRHCDTISSDVRLLCFYEIVHGTKFYREYIIIFLYTHIILFRLCHLHSWIYIKIYISVLNIIFILNN